MSLSRKRIKISKNIINSPVNDHSFFKPSANVQRKTGDKQPGETDTLNYAITGGGKPLERDTKNFMQSRFGYDFGNVKIHNDGAAHQSAESINALAYTHGSDIVFGREQYQPGTNQGRQLIAHELTHVVQQSRNPARLNIQRSPDAVIQTAPVTGTKSTNSSYELDNNSTSPRQVKSATGTSAFPDTQLAYDEGSSKFSIVFALAWIFPHGWDDSKRDAYVAGFERSVMDAWNDRFLLNETGTHRSAHVNISFDENIVHQMKDNFEEAMALDKILKSKSVWTMDTRNINVRDNVSGTNVQLDQDANKNQTRKGSDLTSGASFVIHDGNENKTFTQNTSAHEFGHMMGLGDEYLNDNGTPVSQLSAARAHVNDRIMNVGNNVTADVYAPFADWLSTLTKTTWKVGNKIR